jgi:hypothetical protein
MIGLAIVAGVLVLIAAVVVYQKVRSARQNERRARRALEAAFPGKVALRWEVAIGSGVQEPMRLRGTGVLALYDDALVFVRLRNLEATRIPLADISDITRMRAIESFLEDRDAQGAQSTPEWSLRLEWKADGTTQAAAWTVFDADDWIASLARARP